MKILFYNHTGQASGAEYLLLMVLGKLERNTFEATVVCPEDGPLRKLVAGLGVPTATVTPLRARFTVNPIRLVSYLTSIIAVIRDLRRTVQKTAPDLIHANSIRAGIVASAATLGLNTPVVWHLHDLLPAHPISHGVRLFAWLSSRARMIAVSGAVAENFIGPFSSLRSRVTVILNGIDLDRFTEIATARRELRREFRVRRQDLVIGIVGQLTPRKGQLELIEVLPKVVREIPEAQLMIVGEAIFEGDQHYAASLRKTARELGVADRVRFTGNRKDVPAVMQALDLLVVNSKVEPFGLVVVESMACGTPIIATATGGIPEIIQHGRSGWLVKVGDQHELSTAITQLARQPGERAKISAEAKRQVIARFSADRFMRDLQDFYRLGLQTQTGVGQQALALSGEARSI